MKVLDLFSAAAGGWSLGLHRAGFQTVAACEWIDWRRALYAENNPGVLIYDDVRTLTADRLRADFGTLPDIVVGSPPCQDISSANTKGKGVDGERSGLFFEAVRIIGEVRPRWFALENSANLRTRGADRVLGELEALGYSCWARVVGGDNIGANHERKRSWIIGCDVDQLAHSHRQFPDGRPEQSRLEGQGGDLSGARAIAGDFSGADGAGPLPWRHGGLGLPADATSLGCNARAGNDESADAGVDRRVAGHDDGHGDAANSGKAERGPDADARSDRDGQARERRQGTDRHAEHAASCDVDASDADGVRRDEGRRGRRGGIDVPVQENTCDAPEIGRGSGLSGRCAGADSGPEQSPCRDAGDANGQPGAERVDASSSQGPRDWRGGSVRQDAERGGDGALQRGYAGVGQVGLCEADRRAALQHRADWSLDDLARHIRLDDGLPAWVAGARVAVGGPRGTSAASLIVEAFGDAVLPQIPEAIGRAILRVEAAYAALHLPANDSDALPKETAA